MTEEQIIEQIILNAFEDELEKIAMLGTLFGAAKKAPKAIPKPSTKFVSGIGSVGRGAQTQMRTGGIAGKSWRMNPRHSKGSAGWGVAPMAKVSFAQMSDMEKAAFLGKIMPALRGMMGGARKAAPAGASLANVQKAKKLTRLQQIQSAGGRKALAPRARPQHFSRMDQFGPGRGIGGSTGGIDSTPGFMTPRERKMGYNVSGAL